MHPPDVGITAVAVADNKDFGVVDRLVSSVRHHLNDPAERGHLIAEYGPLGRWLVGEAVACVGWQSRRLADEVSR